MGGIFRKSKGPSISSVNADNIVKGNNNVILTASRTGTHQPCSSSVTKGRATNVFVYAENIVDGNGNRIETGQATFTQNGTSFDSKSRFNPTSNLTFTPNFLKDNDDKDFIRNRRIVSKASHSVGIIRGPAGGGTGFRVGDKYVMTARHVVIENIKVCNEINPLQIKNRNFFIEFEYLTQNQKQNPEHIFYFKDMVYENEEQDTAILELEAESNRSFPPSITIFESVDIDRPVYLIGHPNGEPLMDDPKIELYQYCKEDVDKSVKWACTISKDYGCHYKGIDDQKKCLFHCASQHGASGALGVMVTPYYDEPVGVLMLLRGFPDFYYSKKRLFSDEDKQKFLRVEQGVLLKSIENDMILNAGPNLINEIFSNVLRPPF